MACTERIHSPGPVRRNCLDREVPTWWNLIRLLCVITTDWTRDGAEARVSCEPAREGCTSHFSLAQWGWWWVIIQDWLLLETKARMSQVTKGGEKIHRRKETTEQSPEGERKTAQSCLSRCRAELPSGTRTLPCCLFWLAGWLPVSEPYCGLSSQSEDLS